MIKKTTNIFLLTFLALITLTAFSGEALAAKKGTISADRCGGGVVKVKLFGVLGAPQSLIVNSLDNKVYRSSNAQSTRDKSTIYTHRGVPQKLNRLVRIAIPDNNLTYTSRFSDALKRGKGTLC